MNFTVFISPRATASRKGSLTPIEDGMRHSLEEGVHTASPEPAPRASAPDCISNWSRACGGCSPLVGHPRDDELLLQVVLGASREPGGSADGLRLPVIRRLMMPSPARGNELAQAALASTGQNLLDNPDFTHSTRRSRLTSEPGSDVTMSPPQVGTAAGLKALSCPCLASASSAQV